MRKSLCYVLIQAAGLTLCACQAPSTDPLEPDGAEEAAREIKVITSGGFAAAYDVLGPQFEATTGIKLVSAYGASTGGAEDSIPSRLSRGEAADVIILSRPALDQLTSAGEVRASTRVDLARSSIGMAVREGAPKPDISTTEAFVSTVIAAESIGYSASLSGIYVSTDLFPRLGIWEQIQSKSQRIVSERVATVVARGDIEIGFQQTSEILSIEGAEYVGPIPAELQKVSTFSAGITERSENPEDAQRLIDFISSEAVADTVAATGLDPVVREVN